jgi:hypothetical protein
LDLLGRLLKFAEADSDAAREFVGAVLENQAVQQNDCDCRIVRIYPDSVFRCQFADDLLDVQLWHKRLPKAESESECYRR